MDIFRGYFAERDLERGFLKSFRCVDERGEDEDVAFLLKLLIILTFSKLNPD